MTEHPPGWHPDPRGRHEHRYWDGEQWTDHVADGGVTGQDDFNAQNVEIAAPIGPSMVNLPAIDPSLMQQISSQQAETRAAEPPAAQPPHAPEPAVPAGSAHAPAQPQPQPAATSQPAPGHRGQAGPEDALEKASDVLDGAAASMAHKPLSLAALLTIALPGFGHLYLGVQGGKRSLAIGLLVATIVAANVASWISWPIGLLIYLVALGFALADLRDELAPMQQQRTSGGPLAMFSDLGAALSWRLVLISSVLLAVSLVLPWYRFDAGGLSGSLSAFDTFRVIDIVLLVIALGSGIAAVLNLQQGTAGRPATSQLAVIVAAAGAAALALVVFRLLLTPGGPELSIGRSFGAQLAFIGSLLLAGGAAGAATSKS